MIELKGKYNSAKVFTDNIDNETVGQLTALLNQEFVKDNTIRIMPDTHAGKGCVIGTTMTIKDKIVPNLVGVDIGCFTGDTKVWLSSGHYERIDLLVGKSFIVDSFDEEQKCFVHSKAVALKTRENASLVSITYKSKITSNITTVRCTPDHKFLVSTDTSCTYFDVTWVEAKDLVKGMRLVSEDDYVYVENVVELQEREDVYCLSVDDTHNFVLDGGIIVHNCGMLAVKLKEKQEEIDLAKVDTVINNYIPSGFNIRDKAIATSNIDKIIAPIDTDKAYKSLGTLGGGNHYIECNKDSQGNIWLVIHTGSRHLGIEVCDYYQKLAYDELQLESRGNRSLSDINKELVQKLTAEGRKKEISKELKKAKAEYEKIHTDIPYELAYLKGENFDNYIHDMKLAQEHARINRQTIANEILKRAGLHEVERFDTIHNYIDTDNMILRKGSISAQAGERVIIPMNMRDGSLICIGKGNSDWNCSAPHGAGRLMSRAKAKESISMSEFKDSMKGVYSTSVCISTIDEAPQAYKPMEEIIENIKDTVDIIDIIKPIYNFKAH